jgi:hypothetical protein
VKNIIARELSPIKGEEGKVQPLLHVELLPL